MQGSLDLAHARLGDPETSHDAAASISPKRNRAQKDRILAVLRIRGPLTDEEMIRLFRTYYPEFSVTDQSLRSRRADLEHEGEVWFSGEFGETSTGRRSRKWSA